MSREILNSLINWSENGAELPAPVFEIVSKAVDDFIGIQRAKTGNKDFRFETLKGGFLIDKLMDKGGFKYLAKTCRSDSEIYSGLMFLLRQYNSEIFLKENPALRRLNDDVKKILKQFEYLFISTDSKYQYRAFISLKEGADFNDYANFLFSNNSVVDERLSNIFEIMFSFLKTNGQAKYSNLLNEVESKLGLIQNQQTMLGENQEDTEDEGSDALEENPEDSDDETDELEKKGIVLSDYNENRMKEGIFAKKFFLEFMRRLTERQKAIFQFLVEFCKKVSEKELVVQEENFENDMEITKEKFSKTEYINEICVTLDIGKSTCYNEIKYIQEKLKLVSRKHELDEMDLRQFASFLLNRNNEGMGGL